jgi:hypothetical protein
MRVEIVQVTSIYPMVFVIEEGSFELGTLSAKVVCKVHIDDAEKIKKALNGEE